MHFNYFFKILHIIFYLYHLYPFLYSFCVSNPLNDYFVICIHTEREGESCVCVCVVCILLSQFSIDIWTFIADLDIWIFIADHRGLDNLLGYSSLRKH